MKAIITVVGIVFIIAASFYSGIWWQESKNPAVDKFVEFTDSPLLQSVSFVVKGKVSGIEGRTLTLDQEGEALAVNIAQNAVISLISAVEEADGTFSYQTSEGSFGSILVGDNVAVTVNGVPEEGFALLGKSVVIMISN